MMVGLLPVTFHLFNLYTIARRRVVLRLRHAAARRGLPPHTSTNLTTYPYSLRIGKQTSRLLQFPAVVIIIFLIHPLSTLTHSQAERIRRQGTMGKRIRGAVVPQLACTEGVPVFQAQTMVPETLWMICSTGYKRCNKTLRPSRRVLTRPLEWRTSSATPTI